MADSRSQFVALAWCKPAYLDLSGLLGRKSKQIILRPENQQELLYFV